MNASLYAVPVLLGVALLGFVLTLTPTPGIAGKIMQAGQLSEAVSSVMSRRRVSGSAVLLLSVVGVGVGFVVGAVLSGITGGTQGWWAGGALSVIAGLAPRFMFVNGWSKRFVTQIEMDILCALNTIHTLSGIACRPVDEAVRSFARSHAGRSALAELLLECPSSESPVEFLRTVDIPGQAYAGMTMAFLQANQAPDSERERVLDQHVQMALANLKIEMMIKAKRNAQLAIIAGVLILLPALMVAVLAPPILSFMSMSGGVF